MKQRLPIVLSTAALVVAVLGATPVGEAARELVIPRGSVGTPQLKKGAVTAPKLAKGAVNSAKVLNGSLLAADSKAGQLPSGEKGDKGDPGPAGPPGLSELQFVSATSPSNSDSPKFVTASCPEGKKLVAGGGAVGSASVSLRVSAPAPGLSGWNAGAHETSATASSWAVSAVAVCARTG
jgi:hypothetical protein